MESGSGLIPENNVGAMLVKRRVRWANIGPTLAECFVFAEMFVIGVVQCSKLFEGMELTMLSRPICIICTINMIRVALFSVAILP